MICWTWRFVRYLLIMRVFIGIMYLSGYILYGAHYTMLSSEACNCVSTYIHSTNKDTQYLKLASFKTCVIYLSDNITMGWSIRCRDVSDTRCIT